VLIGNLEIGQISVFCARWSNFGFEKRLILNLFKILLFSILITGYVLTFISQSF
jgi:hypothetical protein